MLVLGRRAGEAILLDGGVRIVVLSCDRRGVRLGVEAPTTTRIQREELVVPVAGENRRARAVPAVAAWAARLPLRSAGAAPPTANSRPAALPRVEESAPDASTAD